MQILVLNSGSSSLKIKLFEMPGEHEIAWGMVERIGEGGSPARLICRKADGRDDQRSAACPDHTRALDLLLKSLADLSGTNPTLIGHRLVHGADLFSGPAWVDDAVFGRIETLQDLAPLHMPPALAVLQACRERFPQVPQVACFDTAFYFSMPAKSYLYAVPRQWHTDHGVRRFGFHGLSHQYVTLRAADMLGFSLDRLKLVSAHLGNGASITAFERGRVLDTSMGFTPLEGLIMGTRAGYLDPAVLRHVQHRTGMTLDQMVEILNTRSGLAAISGLGRDLRTIMQARARGHADAGLAIEMYVHTLRKYVGAYTFALGGADALVFTGGVGENAAKIRQMVLGGLEELGLIMDAQANQSMLDGRSGLISAAHSRIKVLVIPTNEECMIARQAYNLERPGRES
ncbi:MAG: acetate kinase [Desulfobacteraceae bacterium]|nr:MAG: acetate kinase [Desulfobacteraceae bacterium]